jgi:hypothetical protein
MEIMVRTTRNLLIAIKLPLKLLGFMPAPAFAAPLRILSYVVIAVMAVALVYAAYIMLANWSGIAV